nr:hypothetical protein [Raineya sp.]
MKNQFLAITLLSLLVFGACKPRSQELTPHTAINPDLIEQAKTHFENEQSITLSKPIQVSIAERGNRVNLWNYPVFRTFKPIWNKTEQVTLLNGNKVLITPLRRNMKVDYNNLYYIRRLRIELNAQNQIVKTNIVELVTLKHTVASQKYQIIANVFEEIHTRTDAKIMVFDAGYTPQIENSTLWKGEANNNNNANNKGSNGSDTPPVCYYLTAVASCTDVQYLADISTSCDPGDPSGTIYGVGAISNNCQSGGGGSGYIGNPDNPVGGVGTPWGDNGQDQPLDPNYLPPTFSDPEGIYKAYKEALV